MAVVLPQNWNYLVIFKIAISMLKAVLNTNLNLPPTNKLPPLVD
jgi:hypothetical protein